MKISVNRASLQSSFATASSFAAANNINEKLCCVKLTVDAHGALLEATSFETSAKVALVDWEKATDGTVLLPVAQFTSILRESSDEEITIESTARGTMVRGSRTKFNLPSADPSSFPVAKGFDAEKWYDLNAVTLRQAVQRTEFCCADNSSRYALGGILFEFRIGNLTAVATDGNRVAKFSADTYGATNVTDELRSTVIPEKAMRAIAKALPEEGRIAVAATANDIVIQSGNSVFSARALEGRFPQWQKMIPDFSSAHRTSVLAGLLFSGVRQAAICCSAESRGVDFKFGEGTIALAAHSQTTGESSVDIPCDYVEEPVTLVLDNRIVADFLRAVGDKELVGLAFRDPDSPLLMTTSDGAYTYVAATIVREG